MVVAVHDSLAGGPVGKGSLAGLPGEAAFSADEYQGRVDGVRKAMKEASVDVLLVNHPPNVYYLSGYQSFAMYNGETVIVPPEGPPTLMVHPPELGTALLHTWLDEAHGYPKDCGREEYVAKLLVEQGLAGLRVGVEKGLAGMNADSLERLTDALPGAEIVDGSGIVSTVKIVKSPQEIEYLRQAARITSDGITAAIEAAGEGASDNDVAAAGNRAMFEAGTEYMCLSPIVTSGRRSGILHSTHKRVPLARGDNLCMEFGACVERYTAPMMRTAAIGEPSPDAARLADACLTALDNVLSTLRAGISADEVARAGWEGIDKAGPGLVFHGVFAYAVGAGFPPAWSDGTAGISLGNETRLRPGMVFHHPVALRRLGQYGAMFSETTLITEDGCEVLTNVERRLFVK